MHYPLDPLGMNLVGEAYANGEAVKISDAQVTPFEQESLQRSQADADVGFEWI